MSKKSIPIFVVIFLMLSFSSCTCIYFNTFHNIRKSFNGAEKTRKKQNRDKAKGSEVKHYNDAITKASRVLERHPNSSWVDDALYIIGASYYHLSKFDKSARKFKELFANYPESEFISPARIIYAKVKLELNQEAEAIVIFEEIFEKEPDRKIKTDAARSLAQYFFDAKDYDKANAYFEALIDSLGDESDKLSAYTFMGNGYFDRYQFRKAFVNFEEALKQQPDTLQYFEILFRMAECDFMLNDITTGLERLEELADNDLYFNSLAKIRLMMAQGFEWDGDLGSAIDTYEKVADENSRREEAAVAYYQLGLIYQYDIEDLNEAQNYYNKAREEKSKSSVFEDATRRASRLALLAQYIKEENQDLTADSTGQIDPLLLDMVSKNQFLLGELFYMDLDKPDSAIQAYQVLLDKFPNSRYAPRALLSMSAIYRDEYVDTSGADSLLRLILTDFSNSDEAEKVIGLFGLTGTLADTGYAAIPFKTAEQFFQEFIELDSSQYYLRVAADSSLAAETKRLLDSIAFADSARVADSIMIADSLPGFDSLLMEDSLKISDSLIVADTILAGDSLSISDSLPPSDSLAEADLFLLVDSIMNIDSLWTFDSTWTFDSALISDLMDYSEYIVRIDSSWSRERITQIDTGWAYDSILGEDSVWTADSTLTVDSSRTVEVVLALDTIHLADIARETKATPAAEIDQDLAEVAGIDSTWKRELVLGYDSIWAIDSSLIEDSLWTVDSSLQKIDSVRVIDSILVIDTTFKSLAPEPADSGLADTTLPVIGEVTSGDSLATDSLGLPDVPDSGLVVEASGADEPAPADSGLADTTLSAIKEVISGDSSTTDSLGLPDVPDSGLVVEASGADEPAPADSMLSDTTLSAIKEVTAADSLATDSLDLPDVPDSGSAYEPLLPEFPYWVFDSLLSVDSSFVLDSVWVPDTALKIDSIPDIDYWSEALTAAAERYNERQMGLLDSALYYYQHVIDNFPFSDYSIQARYVKLYMYDNYLTQEDQSLHNMYSVFVDSFPESEFALAISEEYNIHPSGQARRPKKQEPETTPEPDSAQAAQEDDIFADMDSTTASDAASSTSRFITDEDGNELQPADLYFLRENIPFEYPIQALGYMIEDLLYFQIRIDFTGEVTEVRLMNPTDSDELNERIIKTVEGSRFDEGRIPPELYDSWFYYKREVKIPYELRQ